ncbi:ATP-grasp domain-containing protein [Planctomycetota bacterium]
MRLFYDKTDLKHAKKLGDSRLAWLRELGATELSEAALDEPGFLFGYDLGLEHLEKQVASRPTLHDRPEERQELLALDHVLDRLHESGVDVPTPKTWILRIDEEPPSDLEFPLFVRTPKSSWKRGGDQAKARNLKELDDEVQLLRRTFGWDVSILARKWLDIAVAGQWMFGNAPQEIRVWVVDHSPTAWSFHYLHAVPKPKGFPPSDDDLDLLRELAARVASPFRSRLIVTDFVRDKKGAWHFLEAGPGAVAGTAHEDVFKHVAATLIGRHEGFEGDDVGGRSR